jgi:dTDP-3-amino-3,4,6-trideoxy-alpha-D-glucose transaminase
VSDPRGANAPILLNDFRAQWPHVREAVQGAVERVGESGWFVLGAEVASFEKELARVWGLPFCVGCASGLDAIEIALRCAGLERGDAVLTTPLSAFATTLAVIRAGGVPHFVDVDATGQIDLALAERALETHREIRFLLPVHLYGHALDLEALERLRARFELRVVEDCAQAVGARSRNLPVGSVDGIAATSFYPTKNLGCMGDGGALLVRDPALAERARCLRDYGQTAKYEHARLGLNSRLDELHAAILRDALLPQLEASTQRRREIAARYRGSIRSPGLELPPTPEGSQSVWHLFPILVSGDRDAFQEHLRRDGIASGVHYPKLIPDQAAFREAGGGRALSPMPRAGDFARREVSLPIHPFLSERDVERVVASCNAWCG